jgi:hypothetical protein
MSLQLSERLGVLEPQIVHLPPDVVNLDAADEAIQLADRYELADGFPLDESQQITLRAALGERADGSWAAATVCDFEPRQNGKNDTVAARELAGLILFGERLIIHTAHEFPTANESFLRLVAVFENWDDLRRRVARIRYANGEQGIELLSGQRLKYKARTGGSGRGFAKADLIVYDEAQHLQAEHVAASGPARLANPNSQAWYMGSGGLETSANAWRLRKRALAGDAGRLAYIEHTAEQVKLYAGHVISTRPEVLDREAWAIANPAYGRRITDESLFSLYEELGPDLFARECLCLWDPEPDGGRVSPFGPGKWEACADTEAVRPETICLAFDLAPLSTSASIGVAGKVGDRFYVDVAVHDEGIDWLVAELVRLRDQYHPARIVCDELGPTGALLVKLEAAGFRFVSADDRSVKAASRTITKLGTRQHQQACGAMFLDVVEGRLVHPDVHVLNAAVFGAEKRDVGDAWLWSRKKSDVDISPLVAVTLARWAAEHPVKRVLTSASLH